MKTSRKKIFTTILKISLSVFLLYFVFNKISFKEIANTFRDVEFQFVLLSFVFFFLSQWVSANRLLFIFHKVKFNLAARSNNKLYLIGMFYNFFIPGGIGGDAYKVYILNKEFKWKIKTLTSAVFIDRFLGLTAIGILISPLSYNILKGQYWLLLIAIAILLIIITSKYFLSKFFGKFKSVFTKALGYSLVIQILQLASVICIMWSMDQYDQYINYLLIFLISSVLSIFSFSGIGVREFIFYEASILLEIDSSIAVSIGLMFSLITALTSIFGIVLHFKRPKFSTTSK